MSLFDKGKFVPVSDQFRLEGIEVLQGLTKFQIAYNAPDTDTAINQIRDALISHYLGYDLMNIEKHGFDAKKSDKEEYLEIKQCSFSSGRLGGTWNDTSEEKARLFSDPRVFTAIAIWKHAADLQFIVYGQHQGLGEYLLERVQNRKAGSRSTQNVDITALITKYDFEVVCPPERDKKDLIQFLAAYNKKIIEKVSLDTVKSIGDY